MHVPIAGPLGPWSLKLDRYSHHVSRVRRLPGLWNNVHDHRTVEQIVDLPCFRSTRFIVFDRYANIVVQHQIEFPQYYPEPG